jgi:hypothetical protein
MMILRLIAALLGFVALVSPAMAQEVASNARALPPMSWVARPSLQDRIENYPAAARDANVSGRALMDCLIRPDLTAACTVLTESPPALGFGEAALALASLYRAPATASGQPTPGGRTLLEVFFSRSILAPTEARASPGFSGALPVMSERPRPANLITDPVWIAEPTPAQLAAAHPHDAPRLAFAVSAELECVAGLQGLLHCNGVSVPTGYGAFGPAARLVVQHYRIAEADAAGVPTPGRPIYVTIRFAPLP